MAARVVGPAGYRTLRNIRRAAIVDGVILAAIGVWAGADILYNEWKARR